MELACHVGIKIVLDMSRHSKHHLSCTKTIKVNILNSDLKRTLKDGKALGIVVISKNIINDIIRFALERPIIFVSDLL